MRMLAVVAVLFGMFLVQGCTIGFGGPEAPLSRSMEVHDEGGR